MGGCIVAGLRAWIMGGADEYTGLLHLGWKKEI